jgi:large subunit ribosomal protein L15
MKLHHLKPAPGAHKAKKRVGRGISAGSGKTAGRGTKGQKARSKIRPGFEGGQTPLTRRLPKFDGFVNRFRIEYHVINVGALEQAFDAGATITPDLLREKGLVRKSKAPVKVLAEGNLTKALTVRVDKVSAAAAEKIRAAGGTTD